MFTRVCKVQVVRTVLPPLYQDSLYLQRRYARVVCATKTGLAPHRKGVLWERLSLRDV